jgi:Fe-S-cluster formation regulator IscX/YfhJ
LAQNGYDYDYDEPDDNDDSEESRGAISEAIMLVWQSET